ncbi:hypothetical protein [Oceanivirga salmonicida]|uniref:hypothetical protein n=1 Tax=Oceanivirga salmonicida TaxID=1769291 RepID=UPI0012E32BB2|nr:hypothetical protein [Oceanivirga salmonicida]
MKKILMTILMLVTLIACGKKEMVLLNTDGSVTNEYVDSTYSEIEKISLEKIKEENKNTIKKAIGAITNLKIDNKGLPFKLDLNELNSDLVNLINIFLDSYKYELKSISYLSENEVDVEYLAKIPNIFSIEDLIDNEKFINKISNKAFEKINDFNSKNPEIDELGTMKFILKEVAPNIVKESVKYIRNKKGDIGITAFVSLKKVNNKWELVSSINNVKSDSKYSVLVNKELKIEPKYIEETKADIEKVALFNKEEISNGLEFLKAIYSDDIIEAMKLIQKTFDEEIKAIYFVNTDKVFVKKEIKIFEIYSTVTEFLQLILDDKLLALEDDTTRFVKEIKKIIERKINAKEYVFLTQYLTLEKKDNKWAVVINSDLEKIIKNKYNNLK